MGTQSRVIRRRANSLFLGKNISTQLLLVSNHLPCCHVTDDAMFKFHSKGDRVSPRGLPLELSAL